jgi:hypothetical protein
MKIHYYEYTDDGENWHKGAASFHSLEILQLAKEQPYEYRIHTTEFDPSRMSKRWNEEKIAHNLKEAVEVQSVMEFLKTFE